MSFSSDLKEELSRCSGGARHCRVAELRAILTMCGGVCVSTFDRVTIRIQTENLYVVRRFCYLVYKLSGIGCEVCVRSGSGRRKMIYAACIPDHDQAVQLLTLTGLMEDASGCAAEISEELSDPFAGFLARTCCRRAYLRGAFLVSGSISDPSRFYHFEIVTDMEERAAFLQKLMNSFGMQPGIVARKGRYVVYVKDSEQISDMLGVLEGTKALLEYENIRILREISGSVNRKVNCETANINKTVGAAVKQIEDICYIRDNMGLARLPDNLRQMAELRLEEPDMPLKDLGMMLVPSLGKSGVNHRLRKLSEIAGQLREQKEKKAEVIPGTDRN